MQAKYADKNKWELITEKDVIKYPANSALQNTDLHKLIKFSECHAGFNKMSSSCPPARLNNKKGHSASAALIGFDCGELY